MCMFVSINGIIIKWQMITFNNTNSSQSSITTIVRHTIIGVTCIFVAYFSWISMGVSPASLVYIVVSPQLRPPP
jgi:hypothetical protein